MKRSRLREAGTPMSENKNTLANLIRAHAQAIDELVGRHGAAGTRVRAVIAQHNRAIARLCVSESK